MEMPVRNTDGISNAAFNAEVNDYDDVGISEPKKDFIYDDVGNSKEKNKKQSNFISKVAKPYDKAAEFSKKHSHILKFIVIGILCAGYTAFFIAACVLNFNRAIALLVITCVVLFFLTYDCLMARFGKHMKHFFKPLGQCLKKNKIWIKWAFAALVLIGLIVWLAVDTAKRPSQLISFGGVCMFVIFLFIVSKHHRAVSWRAVFWGLGLEFVLGIFIIRTEPGYQAFNFLGQQIQIFLNYTVAGSGFVFGQTLVKDVFAFQALPIVVFFSCVMSILYYVGLMQYVILKISWLMQVTMGTTATETLSVAGNIFVGQTEAPLLIRPYLPHMTKSEIHAVMTGGFGTIAGSVMGAYISFGIDPSSLIAASVMAAPCALALSKLVYPETEESKFKNEDGVKIEKGEERTILEAASNGAAASVGLVANIAANLIAFMALLEFINSAFSWLGGMVNYPQLTLQLILSYIFMPVAFMMGVEWDEAGPVGEMLGTKIILNEFVAYRMLADYKDNRLQGLEEWMDGSRQWISERAETITTFALCGFANISSIGIMLGGLSSMAVERKGDLAKVVVRALMTGACVSFVNACIAGILYTPRNTVDCIPFLGDTEAYVNKTYSLYVCCKDIFGSTENINGTLSFVSKWENVTHSTTALRNCCSFYNSTVCTGL
ncbi:sodium/nucleoside cotransporter 2 [Hyla sarda]|uniref:sodium/nucleoside cotransporter 2 n=1 Tax=Hyla sarda TaxID=327740 RepID=UPI0024C415BA|nr:sodium/nucleoside cotransporter 2 [Hyla sarda]XP_056425280.1 sodium/nucleoside cotransporter 2 [Hyla sarda]XP_056425281.1 sodium/nucleoside cotransporter 2 [Hyla sarda]